MSIKKINVVLGFLAGLIGPPTVMYIYYFIGYRAIEFGAFINQLIYSTLFTPVLSLSVLVNLLLFFIFIWRNKDEGSMGVLLATILYAFLIFGMKFFG